MSFPGKVITALVGNGFGLFIADRLIPGFEISGGTTSLITLSILLGLLNFFIKPVLKLVLGPLIVITLGIGIVLVNMIIFYLLDIISKNLTIETIPALIYASLIMGVINFISH